MWSESRMRCEREDLVQKEEIRKKVKEKVRKEEERKRDGEKEKNETVSAEKEGVSVLFLRRPLTSAQVE